MTREMSRSSYLPDPLVMLNGDKVKDIDTWKQKRRPEILKLFETNVYGRTMVGRPDGMTWKVTAENRSDMNGTAITKTVTIYFTGKDRWAENGREYRFARQCR